MDSTSTNTAAKINAAEIMEAADSNGTDITHRAKSAKSGGQKVMSDTDRSKKVAKSSAKSEKKVTNASKTKQRTVGGNQRTLNIIRCITDYMVLMAFRKYCIKGRGQAIRKQILNKNFYEDVLDRRNMQQLNVGYLRPIEMYEIKLVLQELRKRGLLLDEPDGINIPVLEQWFIDIELELENKKKEHTTILKEQDLMALLSRQTGRSSTVQRTSPRKIRELYEIHSFALTEKQIPSEEENAQRREVIPESKPVDNSGFNDENKLFWDDGFALKQ
ncbi:unnamed protein product [Thelazia callipaeda]|uniref:Uncharacterized protein n=1 Tax=Thelazia callipaeda TaxID=103827 RepID=A0A0N5CWL9_THECL|nr:unnamed protein product [Thelazia callipaeda]